MKDHIKNVCFRKTLLITLLLIILKYTKYDYLEKENGEKPKYTSDISPPSLLRTYFDVYVNRKNKDVKELKKLLKNVTISNDYLCTVKKVDINVYNKICGNKVNKIILSNERKYGENDLKKKCISTGSSSCKFGEEKKQEKLFTNYEKRNVYKNSSLLEDFDENGNTNKNFLFGLFDIIAKIKKIIIDTSNKIISMCLFNTGNHEENVFYIKNNKGYDELQNSNLYNYYENSNINIYSINKELYGYNEEYANKYLYSFIDISSDNLNINFYQKGVQGEDGNIAPEIFKNKNVHNLYKDKKYDSHSKIDDGNKSDWGVSNNKTEKYILETETNRNINFKNGQFLIVSDYFWKKSEKWNESKITQSKKLHKKNDEMIHRLIGRILADNDHEYENLSLNQDRDRERDRERGRERDRERENERKEEIEWKRQGDKNQVKYSAAEERLLLIIREKNGDPKSDNSDKSGVTVLEFSRLPPKKRRRACTILAENESDNSGKDSSNDSKASDNKNNSSGESSDKPKDHSTASPVTGDVPECKINMPYTLIGGKEPESASSDDKSQDYNPASPTPDKETNSSDKKSNESKEYDPDSQPAEDIPEGKINRPSRLIAEKESENKSENKNSENKNNSSDKNDEAPIDYSPASPAPADTPEGKINRPSRLIAEKESENKSENKSSDNKNNSSDKSDNDPLDYSPASPAPADAPEGKINRPSRLIAEKESENKSEDKDKDQDKETNSSDKKSNESKEYDPDSQPAEDIPEETNSSDKNNGESKEYDPASQPAEDIPEGKINRPSRLIAEKESENKSENKNSDNKNNSSDKNDEAPIDYSPASPAPADTPEGKTNRPSRLIAEQELENKENVKYVKQYKPYNPSNNNNDVSKYYKTNSSDKKSNESKEYDPDSQPAEDIPEGKINRPSRLIAEKELEYKDNEQGKEQFSKKNEVNRNQNASHKSIVVENGQKGNGDEEKKSMFENIKKKKEKYRKKYYVYDIIETIEALSSLSDEEYDMNYGAANRAKATSILGKYLRQPSVSNKYLDINLFFDEKPYRYRKGNYYFINPFPYSIIKMKKNEGLAYSEKIEYDGVYCYSLSFNNNSSLTYAIENSFRNVKPIEEIVPGTLTGFKSDDGYQKMLTPMFVEEDMFLHCTFNNEPNEIENRIASFPVKIFLKKNLNKTKGCSFQINKHDSIYKEYAERESFLSKKIILNDENSSNECDITATNEIIGFQCGPPYKHYTNNSNTSYMDKIFFNHVNNEDIKSGEYFKVEPAHCFEEVNTNEHIENVAPGSFAFPNFEMINGGLKSHHTRYLKLNIRDPNTAISCYCNYYNNGQIIYSGIMTINGKKNYNGQSDSIYSTQDINKANDNAKQTGHKKNKINKMENYNDYKYFLNLLSYYNPYFMLYRKHPEDAVKKDFAYDSKHSNKNNDEFFKKIKSKLANLKFSDNDKYIHGMDDNLRYKYDNRHSSVYPISDYDSESYFDSERLSDSYGDTFNDDYISPNSNSYYGENTYNSDDLFSNYDDVNIEGEYGELEPLQDNVTFQDNKSYEDKTQSIVVINKSKNVNVYIPKNIIKNKSKHIKDNEDIEDKKTKDALLKYLLLTYEETPDKNEKLNTKLKLFKEYFPSSKNNIFIEEKENDNTSNKIKNTSDIKEESIEPLNEKQSNNEIEVFENDFTLDHSKSYNHDNANSNNHEGGITDGQINESIPNMIMNKILRELFGHNEYDGNKEENPKKDQKTHQTKINTIENEDEEDLTEKTDGLTDGENIFQKIK
ncbi:hypothetical protein YYG_02590 [Plasmodium vinckei petteri]|uniref:6-Cys domain-containing protein n=1 Tax=Plasmodium vinckei petteri TaxID=138298 RepID=W7B273_PLAVN|nr:hypothetical protein YYG_02590 [Plasmodium vinckei petteri]